MIDTHAHIRDESDIRTDGLKAVILSGASIEDSLRNLETAKKYPIFYPAVGIHPQEMPKDIDKAIETLHQILSLNKNIIAVGECGFDFSGAYNPLAQERLFRGQIALSLFHKKPLIVHSRKAMEETLEILKSYKNLLGVIHCYSGGKKRIRQIIDLPGEFYFGIDGNLTYEDGLLEVVKNIPKERLVLETDSPELTPLPFRNEKNYPEYVKYVYQKTAQIWGMSVEETEKIIDGNAKKLFNLRD